MPTPITFVQKGSKFKTPTESVNNPMSVKKPIVWGCGFPRTLKMPSSRHFVQRDCRFNTLAESVKNRMSEEVIEDVDRWGMTGSRGVQKCLLQDSLFKMPVDLFAGSFPLTSLKSVNVESLI